MNTTATMSPSSWIACNNCMAKTSQEVRFSLSNCGHVFCQSCVEANNGNTCFVCKKPCKMIILSKEMKPDIKAVFQNPEDHLNTAKKAMNFQKSQADLRVSKIEEKYQRAKNEYFKVAQDYKKISVAYKQSKVNAEKKQREAELYKKKYEQAAMLLKDANNSYRTQSQLHPDSVMGISPANTVMSLDSQLPVGSVRSTPRFSQPLQTPPAPAMVTNMTSNMNRLDLLSGSGYLNQSRRQDQGRNITQQNYNNSPGLNIMGLVSVDIDNKASNNPQASGGGNFQSQRAPLPFPFNGGAPRNTNPVPGPGSSGRQMNQSRISPFQISQRQPSRDRSFLGRSSDPQPGDPNYRSFLNSSMIRQSPMSQQRHQQQPNRMGSNASFF